MTQDRLDIAFALGVGLGFGCAAGVAQSLGEGMTHYQIGKMLEELSENQGAMRAIANTAIEDGYRGDPNPERYKALISAICDAVQVRGGKTNV